MEGLSLSLERKQLAVKLETEPGVFKNYMLKELTGKDRDAYLTMVGKKATFHDGKPTGLKSFEDLQSYLIHLSLYDEGDERVALVDVREFPASAQSTLFGAAQKLSALEGEEEEVGND